MKYYEFLESKQIKGKPSGVDVDRDLINPILFEFQKDLTWWALKKGRAAIFADTGLGKSFMAIEWSRLLNCRTLMVAPLSVARQTVREGKKIGVDIHYTRGNNLQQINITNYEMIEKFNPSDFQAVVLDESSILKGLTSKTRAKLIDMFTDTPYRLCCTATPAPNDITEIANHAEFLGIMSRTDMLSTFFVHDQDGWRLKGHAEQSFFKWMASWGMSVKKPSDLGYSDEGYILPKLSINPVFVKTDFVPEGQLFWNGLKGITQRADVRKATAQNRVKKVVEIILDNNREFVINLQNGMDKKPEKRIQQEILSRSEETKKSSVFGMVSSEQRQNRQGKEKDVFKGLLQQKQTQTEETNSRTASAIQREQAQEIYGGQRIPGSNKEEGQGVESSKRTQKEEHRLNKELRNNAERTQRITENTESSMCDMRIERYGKQEDISFCGSRSQDRQGERAALLELQPCDREIQGQYTEPSKCNNLPQWIVWCGLNIEQSALEKNLKENNITYSSVFGTLSAKEKANRIESWIDGTTQVLISKPKVCGFGMNFQNCHNMAFVGLSDSWELYYQCIRREWRFGQQHPVNVWIVLSDAEIPIYENVQRKEREAIKMTENLIEHVAEFEKAEIGSSQNDNTFQYKTDKTETDKFCMMLGDSAERLKEVDGDLVGLSVFSPPFMSLYTYSPTERDIGNSKTEKEFFEHFGFIIDELLRITMPGRNCCVHVAQVPAMLVRDGYIGMKDFRGKTINNFEKHGWVFHGEVVIDKDPQAQAIRTHSKGLMFTQLKKDASWLRPALADYILVFRKPGDNQIPIHPDLDNNEWIEWARPIWYGIRESDTLNFREARENKDERHICALQLGTIERCIRLWSNPGEIICSAFAGIGSEGYEAIRLERKFIGCELKESYWKVAVRNLEDVESCGQQSLFAEMS